jgi:hypothetical protein
LSAGAGQAASIGTTGQLTSQAPAIRLINKVKLTEAKEAHIHALLEHIAVSGVIMGSSSPLLLWP